MNLASILANPFLIAILVYLVALTAVGVHKARSVGDSADFMVAGRRLHWAVLVSQLCLNWERSSWTAKNSQTVTSSNLPYSLYS